MPGSYVFKMCFGGFLKILVHQDLLLTLKREFDLVRIPQEKFSLCGSHPDEAWHLLRVLRRVRPQHTRPAVFGQGLPFFESHSYFPLYII